MNNCQKFRPNIFNNQKCSNCFKFFEEHNQSVFEERNKELRKCGYLFVAPLDWNWEDAHTRTKRWQRRFFNLTSDGLLTYSLDEHPTTIPQASIKVKSGTTKIKRADQETDHEFSLGIHNESNDDNPGTRLFVKAMCKEEMTAWQSALNQIINNHGILRRSNTSPIVYMRENSNISNTSTKSSNTTTSSSTISVNTTTKQNNHHRLNQRFLSAKEFPKQMEIESEIINVDELNSANLKSNNNNTNTNTNFKEITNTNFKEISTPTSFKELNFNLKIRGDPDGSNNNEALSPLRKGWLLRYCSDEKNWLKNWFVLKQNELIYYKNVEETEILNTIKINLNSIICETDSPKHYSFQISNGSSESYNLAAITNGMRNIWIKSIETSKSPIPGTTTGLGSVNKSPIMKPRRNIVKKGELEVMKQELLREREKCQTLEVGFETEILNMKTLSENCKKELEYKNNEMDLIRERLNDLTEKLYQSEKNAKFFKNKFARIKSQSLKDKQSEIELLNKVRSLEKELNSKSIEETENHSIWFHCSNCDELEKKLEKREFELHSLEEQLGHLEEHFDNQLKDISVSNVKYKKDLIDLQEIIGKTLEILEDGKNRIIVELEEKHRRELQKLKLANEESLREEANATIAALESLRRNHEMELKKQMEKFKADFVKSSDNDRLDEMHRQHEQDLSVIQKQIKEITLMYTNKCLEFNHLQEKMKGTLFNHQMIGGPQQDK